MLRAPNGRRMLGDVLCGVVIFAATLAGLMLVSMLASHQYAVLVGISLLSGLVFMGQGRDKP